MFAAGTPTAMRFRAMSATTSGDDIMFGAPEQLILIPTTSLGVTKRAQESRSSLSPVSARIPSRSILRTTAGSTFPVVSSMLEAECTLTTWPRYGPGIPGAGEGLNLETTLYLGNSGVLAMAGAAAVN